MSVVFDPRQKEYKTPFGACPCGSEVSLRIKPPRRLGTRRAALVYAHEQSGRSLSRPMDWLRAEDGADIYGCTLSLPETPGLLWYHFALETDFGPLLWGKDGFGEKAADYQLTVYINRLGTPGWFSDGVVYQIFPDRFFSCAAPDLSALEKRGTLHESWSESPEWRPDGNGKITNSDFFGGSLSGIRQKLSFLSSMGVSVVYINPIFRAASNHRYDTGDYMSVDPLLGDEAAFRALCQSAEELGIRIILDGVFSHTGDDSRYFNRLGSYDSLGAYQSPDSPYSGWYSFSEFPDKYASWWGIDTLPEVNELDGGYMDFIIRGENSVVRHWLRAGASGWRLDVADELPDEFIAELKAAARSVKPDAFILGEVWEDASSKVSYGVRRDYLWGGSLDGVMNYPFRSGLLAYLLGGPAEDFMSSMLTLQENYPPEAFFSCMNFLGTHDTPRILTVLGASETPRSRAARAAYRLSPEEYELGKKRLFLAAAVMFTFPGAPTVYYGDEAGMQGFEDPFNRGTYPWGGEDAEILDRFSYLANLRKSSAALRRGSIEYLVARGEILVFSRNLEGSRVVTMVNAGFSPQAVELDGTRRVLEPLTAMILEE